jgi:hypothetical protein
MQSLPSPAELQQSTQLNHAPMNSNDILSRIELLRQEVKDITGPFADLGGKINDNK